MKEFFDNRSKKSVLAMILSAATPKIDAVAAPRTRTKASAAIVFAVFLTLTTFPACKHPTGGGNDDPVPQVTKAKTLEKIEIATGTEIAVAKDATELSTKGVVVNVTFSDGSTTAQSDSFIENGWNINTDKFDSSAATTGYDQEIIISYEYEGVQKTASFFVRIYDPDSFKSITVKNGTGPQPHAVGSSLNPFGLVVQITLDDDSVIEVIDFSDTTKWAFKNFDSSAEKDDLEVTVEYTSGGKTESATFTMKIYDPDAWTAIELIQVPYKTEYDYGSINLDLTGLNIAITLKDGSKVTVNNVAEFVAPKWTITGFDGSKEGSQDITVTYTAAGKSDSVTFAISVVDKITGIELVNASTDCEYIIGEEFAPSGLKIKIQHLNSAHDTFFEPTSRQEFTGRWELVGWNSGTEAETLPLTVRYWNDDKTASLGECSFNVTIYKVSNITITEPSGKDLIYFEGESIQYVKDIYLATAGVNLDLSAGSKKSTDTYPVTSDIFKKISLTATGDVDSAGTKFEIQPGSSGIANVKCRIELTDTLWFEPGFGVTVIKPYQFHSDIEKFTGTLISVEVLNDQLDKSGTVANATVDQLKFVTFGDYPQTVARVDGNGTYVYEIDSRKKTVGGMDMYLGEDGGYYVKVDSAKRGAAAGDNSQYKFSDGTTASAFVGKECWFKVEPIVWRVLSTNHKGAALLWSVKALDRIPYFADSYSPDVGNGAGLIGGGKSIRTIGDKEIKWGNYKYSTLRAFLRGEYETGDEQSLESYKQIYTGGSGGNPEVLLEKFYKDGEKRGFLQRAFDSSSQSLLVEIELDDVGTKDCIFVLGHDELGIKEPEFYFKTSELDVDSQTQRRKQLTDYTMAREGRRWSHTNGGITVDYPGGEIWTRTAPSSEISVYSITGFGHVFKSSSTTGIGRGAYKAMSVVPAICVDASAITTLFP